MNDHPNAETLSAYLDGQAPEVEGHIATCAECRQQLDVLARVRIAVAAPVPPPEEHQKDAAIAAARSNPFDRRCIFQNLSRKTFPKFSLSKNGTRGPARNHSFYCTARMDGNQEPALNLKRCEQFY